MQFLTEIEFEPNNNFEQATNISDGDARSGQLHSSSDVDVYKITANKPGTINVQLDLPSEDFYGGYNNWSVNLKNTDGEILVSKEYGEFPGTPSFSAAAVTAGDYFLSIESSTNHTDHAYSVSASTDSKLSSTELEPNNAPTGTATLTGDFKIGKTISIDASAIKDVDNYEGWTPDYEYSWEVSGDNGTTWTELTSTDASDGDSSYTLTSAEVGKQLRGVVSYLDGYGTNEQLTSSPASIQETPDQKPEPVTEPKPDPDPTPIEDLELYGDANSIPTEDILNGEDGNDKIYGLLKGDTLNGGGGADLLFGGYGDDLLFGDEGNDELYGQEENDTLNGGSGNDRLTGGEGYDLLIGGPGDDTYIIDDERDTIDDQGLDSDIDTVVFRANLTTYTVPDSIKNARLDSGSAFKLIGNAKANTLIGNDIDNDIDGGDGDDSLDGGGGDDTLKGGSGRDAVIYSKKLPGFLLDGSGAQDITVNLLSGTASGSEIGSDSLIAIEDVLTGDGNDHLTGDDKDNRLDAGGGNDTISSGAGNDSIYGGNGDDLIDGGDGSDTAHFTGNFTDYEVTPTSSGFTITDTRAFHDGTDEVTGIEIFRFSDQSLAASQLLGSDTTNSDTGGFDFTSGEIISTGSSATQDVLIGDVNNSGTHDVSDAISVLRHIVGLEEGLAEFPGVEPIILMDVDSNGQVGVGDAISILRTIVGLEQLDALVQI